MPIKNVYIGSTETTITPVIPEGKSLTGIYINFCNYDPANDEFITIYVKEKDNPAGTKTVNAPELKIESLNAAIFNAEKYNLGPGDSISAFSQNGNRVNATLSYVVSTLKYTL